MTKKIKKLASLILLTILTSCGEESQKDKEETRIMQERERRENEQYEEDKKNNFEDFVFKTGEELRAESRAAESEPAETHVCEEEPEEPSPDTGWTADNGLYSGMTKAQAIEVLGKPIAVDTYEFPTYTRYTWDYGFEQHDFCTQEYSIQDCTLVFRDDELSQINNISAEYIWLDY